MSHPLTTAGRAGVLAAALLLAACTADPGESASPTPAAPPEPQAREAAWTVDIGAESWSQPAAADGVAYVAANDGAVRAIDLQSGTVDWTFRTGGDIRAGLLVDEGVVYAVSDDGMLYAISVDGSERWSTDIGNALAERDDYDNYGSSPRIFDGTLFVGSADGGLYAVDPEDGTVLWRFASDGPVRTTPAFGEGRVYFETLASSAYAVDARTGEEVWRFGLPGAGTTSPAYIDGSVVLGSRGTYLTVVDAASAETRWGFSYSGSWVQSGGVDLGAGVFAIGSSELGVVRAFHVESGDWAWNADLGGWPWAVPVAADGVVYASVLRLDYKPPLERGLYAIDAGTGAVVWWGEMAASLEWNPDGYGSFGVGGSPAIADEFVVVAALDGKVYAYRR